MQPLSNSGNITANSTIQNPSTSGSNPSSQTAAAAAASFTSALSAAVAAQQNQIGTGLQSTNMPTAADFSLMLSLGLGLNPADASQLANLDLQKLAMYLVSILN